MKILSLKCFAVIVFSLFLSNFALADGQRADDSFILDIDASGEVDAMTDGLLMMRSMFGFTEDVLVDGAVAENCTECDSEQIQEHISRVRSATIAQLNSSGEPGPEGPQGEKGEKGDAGPAGSIDFSEPSFFQNNLQVEGPFGTLLGIYFEGPPTFNDNEVGPEGLLEVASPAIFQNDLRVMPDGTLTVEGRLSVEGTTTLTGPTNILGPISFGDEFQVSGTAQMDELFVEGNLNVMGPVSFENGFQVGSNGPNGPMLGAYSELSITPNGNEVGPEGLFEVASPATFQNELRVLGSTVIENELRVMGPLRSDFLEAIGAGLEELSVASSARLGNGINGPVLGAYREGATTYNGDPVGPQGLLEIRGPAVFKNELSVEGHTTLAGPTNILGPVSLGDEFQVSGTAQMNQLFVEGDLNVLGPVSFENGFQGLF